MKTHSFALAVALCAATASAQQTAIVRGQKVLLDKFGNVTTQAPIPLPPAPLVGGADACTTPDVLVGNGPHAFSTGAATTGTQGQANAICNFFGSMAINNDVWFTWTASVSGATGLSVCGASTVDTKIAVYNGTTCPGAAAIACNDDSCGLQSALSFTAVAGNSYVFQVGVFPGALGGTGTFTLTPPSLTPANDLCSAPTAISGLGNFPVNMIGATTDNILPTCLFSTPQTDVWHDWVAPATGTATVAFCTHTTGDTMLAIWPAGGCPTGTSISIACNDDSCGLQSSLSFPATVGTHYLIQSGMFPGNGPVNTSMDITMPPPANDDCSTPTVIPGPGSYPFDTSLATTPAVQPLSSCGSIFKEVWYQYTGASNGTATLTTCGGIASPPSNTFDTKIAVYLGAGCPTLTSLACNDDGACVPQSTLTSTTTFPVICGQVYMLRIGNFSSGTTANIVGTFTISEVGSACLTPPTPYCFGTNANCPCANGGAAGNGCANNSNSLGANLTVTGTNSISADTLVLAGSGMPATSPALYFQGTLQVSNVFGDGLGCAGGNQVRLGTKINAGGASSYPSGSPSVSVKGGAVAGSNLNYQIAYRDASNFCNPSLFNSSNAVNVIWAP